MAQPNQSISPLRQRMIEDMHLRKLAPKTQASYIKADATRQRMDARAVFHERQYDHGLLGMIEEELRANYKRAGLDGQTQDTMAWFCKALGQNAKAGYNELLVEVMNNTPYRKIRKWAGKYVK